MRLLLISEEVLFSGYLLSMLKDSGHHTDWCRDATQGEQSLGIEPYCAAILELNEKSKSFLLRLRRCYIKTPVLALTDETSPGIRADILNAGADDCMNIPPEPDELMARLNAIVRRNQAQASPVLRRWGIMLDTVSREVSMAGHPVSLTPSETLILEAFMMNENRLISKSFLEGKLSSWNKTISSNLVEVHISNLRHKLGKNIIKTVYGLGYRTGKDISDN
ncbi:response regulator transcription factor [Salmonella enterica]